MNRFAILILAAMLAGCSTLGDITPRQHLLRAEVTHEATSLLTARYHQRQVIDTDTARTIYGSLVHASSLLDEAGLTIEALCPETQPGEGPTECRAPQVTDLALTALGIIQGALATIADRRLNDE